MSFVMSLTSAALVFSVARKCKEGRLWKCGCSQQSKPKSLPKEWLWEGCGDDLEYATSFVGAFTHEKERNWPKHSKELARLLSSLHNYQLALQVAMWHFAMFHFEVLDANEWLPMT